MDFNRLWDYDLYHLEQGMGIFRDSRVMLELKKKGKKFACFYHGNDVRNRGIIPAIDQISDLNLTSELDLMAKYPGIKYLFLPIETSLIPIAKNQNEKIRIAHATRSRMNKGSDFIIEVVSKLEQSYPVEMVLIENLPHAECMEIKSKCDIYIDQIADKGGWGYGMSSVESLAMGIPTCTYLNQRYLEFIPDHPFINVSYETLECELKRLIENRDLLIEKGNSGREWVVKHHDIDSVMDKLYGYYAEAGII